MFVSVASPSLPLWVSFVELLSGRQDCEPSELWLFRATDGCVAPRAELARLATHKTVCAQRSVVVGCLDCASLPIAVAVVHDWQVSAVLLAVFPARSHGCLWSSLAVLFGVRLSAFL